VGDAGPSAIEGFGFGTPGDNWLEHLRDAELPAPLGAIGPYELIAEVSRGGQGVVYRARQPGTKREIAIKRLIAGCFASSAERRRFEREIEIAATLDHPNIVRIYAVETVGGEPLLTMQWIDGSPVTHWARPAGARPRTLREILDVFAAICAGAHHAHQNGVIHRDLKPSNILVDGAGVPHILDFGLAKRIVDGANATVTVGFAGTLAYASPEQVSGGLAAVDLRSDVYSLGVILFELLTGRRPHKPSESVRESLRAIEQDEAPAPSRYARHLPGELDAIVGKALAIDKNRRYASVDALGEDVRRYLGGESILAHSPSRWRQLAIFARRRWLPLSSAASVFALVAALAVMQTLNVQRVSAARDREARAARRAQRSMDFVADNVFALASPNRMGADATASELLDEARESLAAQSSWEPGDRAQILATLGSVYAEIGRVREGEALLREALTIQDAADDVDMLDRADTRNRLAVALMERGQYEDAGVVLAGVELYEFAEHERRSKVFASWLRRRAHVAHGRAEYDMAFELARQAHELDLARAGTRSPELADDLQTMGNALLARGDLGGARAWLERAVAVQRELDDGRSLSLSTSLLRLGTALSLLDEGAARRALQEAGDIRRARLGERHFLVAEADLHLARNYMISGGLRTAQELAERADSVLRDEVSERGPAIVPGLLMSAKAKMARGDFERARELLEQAWGLVREHYGEQHALAARVKSLLATVNHERDPDGALVLAKQAVETTRARSERNDPALLNSLLILAHAQLESNDLDGAERTAGECLELDSRLFGAHSASGDSIRYIVGQVEWKRVIAAERLGQAEVAERCFERASAAFFEALTLSRELVSPKHFEQRWLFERYHAALQRLGRAIEAEPTCRELIADCEARFGAADHRTLWLGCWLAISRRGQTGDAACAVALESVVPFLEGHCQRGQRQLDPLRVQLADCYRSLGKRAEYEALLSRAEPESQSDYLLWRGEPAWDSGRE
jgi:tetratricopeptide (TPR) repeat protein/tRNA A-37 threonylcarbamoyl transferase component Bud32